MIYKFCQHDNVQPHYENSKDNFLTPANNNNMLPLSKVIPLYIK